MTLPQNPRPAGQPTGEVIVFRVSSFSGKGDPAAAARTALKNVDWADLNDINYDETERQLRIGLIKPTLDESQARRLLGNAGLVFVSFSSREKKK